MLGRIVLGYEIVRSIGQGSMGQVWLARDRRSAREVVVKMMKDHVAPQPKFRALFQREMQFMARFKHPHAVEFFEGSLDDPAGPCIVMEYVPGIELDRILEVHHVLAPDRVGRLTVQICQALNAAHRSGIVHRDLKPTNVMVINAGYPDEFVKVMDLGLARLTAKPHIPLEKLQGSAEAHAVGTPAYMCPEQLRGDETDHRADIYSLGVMLFELLTGRLPFDDASTMDLLHAHIHRPPPAFRDVGTLHVPPAVETLVQSCLSKYPIERPQSAYELACRFQSALGRGGDVNPRDFEPTGTVLPEEPTPELVSNSQQTVATLEAWMPEPIALVKLRGFLEDEGGRVVESQPGLIRVRLHEPPPEPEAKPQRNILGWLKRKPEANPEPPPIDPIAIDLHMAKTDPKHPSKLTLTVVFQALTGPLPFDPRWHERCDRLLADLRGYLMAKR